MKNILFLSILLLTIYGSAQNNATQLQKSAVFKDSSKESYLVYTKDDGLGGFYTIRMFRNGIIASPSGYYIEHYDKNMALIMNYEYAPDYHAYEKYKTLLGVISDAKQIHIIEIQYNIKEKAYLCIAHSTAIDKLEFTSKELFRLTRTEADKLGTLGLGDLFYNSKNTVDDNSIVSFIVDDSQTSFGVCLNLKSKENKTLRLYTFDSSLNKKLDHTYIRDVKNKNFIFRNIDVSDDGNSIYLLGAVHNEENKNNHFNYEITHVTSSGEKTSKFENEKPFSESLKMFKVGNRLVCAGFYSEEKTKWYSGVSYFEIDPVTLILRKIKHTSFSEQLLESKRRYLWWLTKFYKPLVFRDFIVTKNEDIIINAEEYYITSTNNGTYYNSDDIISVAISKEGETIWIKDIAKEKSTMFDNSFISYTSSFKNGVVSFYFNAAEKVNELDDDSIQFRDSGKNKSSFTSVSIDQSGKMIYTVLLDNEENEVPFMTAQGIVLPDTVLFLGQKGSKKQLLKINL